MPPRGNAAMAATVLKPTSVRTLFTARGELYFRHMMYYLPVRESDDVGFFTIAIDDDPNALYRYSIVVYDGHEEALRQPIGNGLTLNYSSKENSVHWPSILDGEEKLLAFKFADCGTEVRADVATSQFVEMYNRCTYALMTRSEVDTSFAEDEAYEYVGSIATTQLPYDDYEEPMYELDVAHEKAKNTGVGNVCYSESMRYGQALVVRKANEGVEIQTHAFDNSGFWKGKQSKINLKECLTCDQALLDDTNTKMLLLSVEDNRLNEVDLTCGKVVKDYALPAKVHSVTYGAHVAGPTPVYTCLANNTAFNVDLRMDPRQSVVMEPGCTLNDYTLVSLNKPFTCHATSAEGHLVIGDGAGNIRLYTGPPGSRRKDGKYNPKTAKTLLETKVPILAVDVTADGKYVVAVSAKFLLFMPTTYLDEKNGCDANGFVKRMGKKKPQPMKLQPTPAQLAVLGGIDKLEFVSGGFDRYEDGREVCITACSGNYVFTWGLDAAKRAEENGRACLGESAKVDRKVIGLSATVPEKMTYLTDSDIRMAPLKSYKRVEKGERHYRYS